jgi:hypothetical protein
MYIERFINIDLSSRHLVLGYSSTQTVIFTYNQVFLFKNMKKWGKKM